MIPKVDPQVKYVGTTYLRSLNSDKLRELSGAVVVQAENSDPLAVILPYQTFLHLQKIAGLAPDFEAFDKQRAEMRDRMAQGARRVTPRVTTEPITESGHLDAVGPELSSGRGKATVETRGPRQKGDRAR